MSPLALPPGFLSLIEAVEQEAGLQFSPQKRYLLESRLPQALGVQQLDYVRLAERFATDPDARKLILEALLTHETYFFREPAVFGALPAWCRELEAEGRGPIEIWSLPCSTGQEVDSIRMALIEGGVEAARANVWGFDISEQSVATAEAGRYRAFEAGRGLDAARRERFFEAESGGLRVKPWVRAGVRFGVLNVVAGLGGAPAPHVLFCRNMLIYFREQTKKEVLARLCAHLRPGGILVLGVSEPVPPKELSPLTPIGLPGVNAFRKPR